MYRKFLIIVLVFTYCSCSVKGNFRGLYSYYDKTKAEYPELLINTYSDICQVKATEPAKIYVINGKSIADCIISYDNAVVYIWKPKCTGRYCYPLNTIQKMCDENNIELFIVAEYYDSKTMRQNHFIKRPVFGIDTKYYNSSLTSKYLTDFKEDVTSKKGISNSFISFRKGVYYTSFNTIDSLKTI